MSGHSGMTLSTWMPETGPLTKNLTADACIVGRCGDVLNGPSLGPLSAAHEEEDQQSAAA